MAWMFATRAVCICPATSDNRFLPVSFASGNIRETPDTLDKSNVHMPSHIFRRIGRYSDASRSNVDAIAADEDYITQCRTQGVYPLAYYPHNIHFLWDSATMEGRSRVAIEA